MSPLKMAGFPPVISLNKAVLCEDCRQITMSEGAECLACGSKAIANLKRMLEKTDAATNWSAIYSGKAAQDARMETERLTCDKCGGLQEECVCPDPYAQPVADVGGGLPAIKRYAVESGMRHARHGGFEGYANIEESPEGGLVDYDEHIAIVQSLKAEVAELKRKLEAR